MEKITGIALNDNGDNWLVYCPRCEKKYEYEGYFDSEEETECSCGCIFTTEKVKFEDGDYIY